MSSATTNPIVIVTGSNTGVGYETVRALITGGISYTVILCSRDAKKGQDAALKLKDEAKEGSEVVPLQLDITDDASIDRFVKDVRDMFGRVDILVHNAGVSYDLYLAEGKMDAREAWNGAYDTNVTSTQLLNTALMPLLIAAASSPVQTRILFVSSGVSSHDRHQASPDSFINKAPSAGWPKAPTFSITSYRTSKTGFNMMYREWCRVLANDHIKCHLVCPGLVATNLGGGTPEMAKSIGAEDPALAGVFFRNVIKGKYDAFAGLDGKMISQGTQGRPIEW